MMGSLLAGTEEVRQGPDQKHPILTLPYPRP